MTVACHVQATQTADTSDDDAYILSFAVPPPTDLPAGTYALRLVVPPLGYSTAAAVTVTHTVTGIDPVSGSLAGGLAVTISGTGFSDDARVSLGASPCTVTAASATELTCVTSAGAAGTAAVAVAPSAVFTEPALVEGLAFEYVAAPTVDSISPPRGSTAGGTPVVIRGAGFTEDIVGIAMGDTACTAVTWVSSSEVTCVTPLIACSRCLGTPAKLFWLQQSLELSLIHI